MYTKNVQWDNEKARANAVKHGIGFKEASTAFHDPEAMIADDPDVSDEEYRELLIGESARGHFLVVVFTNLGSSLGTFVAIPLMVKVLGSSPI